MSIPEGHFDVLTAQITSYRESLGSQSSHAGRLKYNSFARDYAKLESQLNPKDKALFKRSAAVQKVFKELRLLKEAMASGTTFPKRQYQPFTFTEVDQGLVLAGTGSLVLSYGLSASYAAVAWPVSIAAFTILGGKKVYDSCCARPAKVKVESDQQPVVSSAVSSRSDTLRRRGGIPSTDRKKREEPIEQPNLSQLAARQRGMAPGKHYTVRLGGKSLFSQSSNLLERLKSSNGRPTYGLLSYGNTVYAVRASADFQHFDIASSFDDIGTVRGERFSYAEMISLNTRHPDVRGIELLVMTQE